MSAATLFRLASVTKAIVCAALMTLVERDELSLESRVDRWLPELRPKLPEGESPEITIRQLLTHTAGLDYRFQQPPDGPYARANVSDGLDRSGLSLQDNIRRIASAPLINQPGSVRVPIRWRRDDRLGVRCAALFGDHPARRCSNFVG
jgi:CubicO group peptidase (beta-lactamase class C family)